MTSKDAEAAKGARIGKALVAIFVLVLITGIVNRLVSSDDGGGPVWPTPEQVRLQPANSTSTVPGAPTSDVPLNELPSAFVAAPWTSSLPTGVKPATIVTVLDGDTFDLSVDGQTSRYRLYRADTPEMGEAMQCGATDATEFVHFVLGFNDTPGQVWIESVDQRDRYDRTLAYIWFTVDGKPYLLNHALINNGWAEDIGYNDAFDPYASQLRTAAAFAQKHHLGVWSQCGGFGIFLAQPPVPTQGPLPTDVPYVAPTQAPAMNLGGGNCDPNYTPCVPDVPYDLDCKDIRFRVQVIGYDRHRFDRDGDGWGCESW